MKVEGFSSKKEMIIIDIKSQNETLKINWLTN